MNTMTTLIKIETRVETPTTREQVLRTELASLPDANVSKLMDDCDIASACERLIAAEMALDDARKKMSACAADLRKTISKQWTDKEIPAGLVAVLWAW